MSPEREEVRPVPREVLVLLTRTFWCPVLAAQDGEQNAAPWSSWRPGPARTVHTGVLVQFFRSRSPLPVLPRFGSVACGIGQELYVFGGVRSQESQNPERRQMMTCKSEFYHEEMRRLVTRLSPPWPRPPGAWPRPPGA